MDQVINSDAIQAIINLTVLLQDMWPVILRLSYFTGFIFMGLAVFASLNTQNQIMMRSAIAGLPNKTAMMYFIAGILLLSLPGTLYHISMSIFNNSSLSVLSYTSLKPNVKGTGTVVTMVKFALAIIMTVGLIAVFKGIIGLVTNQGSIQAVGAAVFNGVFGAVCVNFVLFVQHFGDTLGGSYKTSIDKFF